MMVKESLCMGNWNAKPFKLNTSDAFLEILEEFKISNLSPITIKESTLIYDLYR